MNGHTRRPATVTQATVARAIRAARQAGAGAVEIKQDGSIFFLLQPPSGLATPSPTDDPFAKWEREYEARKASRHSHRD
jgi:hypothetical protein